MRLAVNPGIEKPRMVSSRNLQSTQRRMVRITPDNLQNHRGKEPGLGANLIRLVQEFRLQRKSGLRMEKSQEPGELVEGG